MNRRAEEAADPVGDEIRCVLAHDRALAQMQVAKAGDPVQYFGRSLGSRNDLDLELRQELFGRSDQIVERHHDARADVQRRRR